MQNRNCLTQDCEQDSIGATPFAEKQFAKFAPHSVGLVREQDTITVIVQSVADFLSARMDDAGTKG